MATEDELPSFPAPAVRSRVLELGFGSGLWARADLDARWGASVANKFIDEAKTYGWLVSPFRGEFWIPTAADLMVVPWLSPPLREEFILSRALTASGVKFWCLSSWARSEGLLFPRPVFVTDLSPRDEPYRGRQPMEELRKTVQRRAEIVRKIPFLDRLIIVPELGKLGGPSSMSTTIAMGRPKRIPPFSMTEADEGIDRSGQPVPQSELAAPTTFRYSVTPSIEDFPWLIAFLLALDLPRTNEILGRLAEPAAAGSARRGKKGVYEEDTLAEARRIASRFGPPRPNDDWQSALNAENFPFLLVPPDIWQEVVATTASRRYERAGKLRGG